MLRENKNLTGNARYEGFCIDLLKRIATQIGFQYNIRLVPDHMYGVYDPETKNWNGIVRELIERVNMLYIFVVMFCVEFDAFSTVKPDAIKDLLASAWHSGLFTSVETILIQPCYVHSKVFLKLPLLKLGSNKLINN